MIGFKTLKF